MTDRDFDRDWRRRGDWNTQNGDFRGQGYFGDQDRFGDQRGFGGWGSRENQGGFGDQEFSNRGPYGSLGQGYGMTSGGQGWQGQTGQRFGQESDWRQRQFGGRGFGNEDQFGGWRGSERYGMTGGGWQGIDQDWDNQRGYQGDWEQGQSRRGTWGQGPAESRFSGRQFGSGQGFGSEGYGGQRFGGQGYGSQRFGSEGFGGQGGWGQGQMNQGFGGQGQGGLGSGWVYEEVWLIPGPQTGRGPRGYQRSDQRIEEDVCERLTQHGQLDANDIDVQVNNGEVTLTGTVESRQAKRMAEDAVESIPGIKDVHNQLRVQQGQGQMSQGQMGQGQGQNQTSQFGQGNGKPAASKTAGRAQGQGTDQAQRNETVKAGTTSS